MSSRYSAGLPLTETGTRCLVTECDRYLVIGGRRWRRSDPAIPPKLRAELVAELMDARRTVGAALRAEDAVAESAARGRVQSAKVALGERGEPWWEAPTVSGRAQRISAAIEALLAHRPSGSVCPSDVARVVGGTGWRAVMQDVRNVAFDAAREGSLVIRQRGLVVESAGLGEVRGPIRIARSS